MALYMKQNFTPTILTPRWFVMKLRPNMLLNRGDYIISILESGLLFREDCAEIEQEAPVAEAVLGLNRARWLTKGEALLAGAAVALCVYVSPPRDISRRTLIQSAVYISLPLTVRLTHRSLCHGPLKRLIANMQSYLATARRAAAMIKELTAFHSHIGTLTSIVESARALLCAQQSELCVLMSRASSALLGNAPWLREDVVWDAHTVDNSDNLQQIHHAFMVVQSSLLKHIALAHFIPSSLHQKIYKNLNERIYWIHNVLIKHLCEEFQSKLEALQRMYRVLKFSTNPKEIERKKTVTNQNAWVYSEIQTGVARAALELKLALDKSNSLDILLDSCALNNQTVDVNILDKDLEDLIELITKSLNCVQNSQIRLKSLKNKMDVPPDVDSDVNEGQVTLTDVRVLTEEQSVPVKDEVFYFVKTEDDAGCQQASDVTTAPGRREKEASKIVLNELKRKLGNREDLMRERERQALLKTMNVDKVPEFPRQIQFDDFVTKRGFIVKLKRVSGTNQIKVLKKKICRSRNKNKKYALKNESYVTTDDIKAEIYEANSKLNMKSKILTFASNSRNVIVIRWFKRQTVKLNSNQDKEVANKREELNDHVSNNRDESNNRVESDNPYKFDKRELDFSSSSESDFERNSLLEDIRRYRVRNNKRLPNRQRYRPDSDRNRPDPTEGKDPETSRNGGILPETSKSFENLPEPSRNNGNFPEGFRNRQNALEGYRNRQNAYRGNLEGFRGHQEGFRGHQEDLSTDDCQDEGLKPMEYSLGAGLAMAAMMQRNNQRILAQEEVFIGDGEVSNDSGNDEAD